MHPVPQGFVHLALTCLNLQAGECGPQLTGVGRGGVLWHLSSAWFAGQPGFWEAKSTPRRARAGLDLSPDCIFRQTQSFLPEEESSEQNQSGRPVCGVEDLKLGASR